jgi:uncharacterized small protein (DUF1192 family)
MARLKRSSPTLDNAILRMAGIESINSTLDFGNGLSVAEYDTRIQALQTELSEYNATISGLDEKAERIALLEQELRIYSEKMLMSVATHYGKDSLQYRQAGGTQRKRNTHRSTKDAVTGTIDAGTTASMGKAASNGNGKKATAK